MHRLIRTAVAASTSPEMMKKIAFLLAESEIELVSVSQNGAEALECLKTCRPDLLVADAPLPAIDAPMLIERAIATLCLPVRPMAILLHHSEFMIPNRDKIEAAGAALIEKPVSSSAFADAIERLSRSAPVFPEAECVFVEKLLDELGFPEHNGSKLLKYAALIAAHDEILPGDISSKLVPMAAEMCSVTPVQAERAMRHAIAKAWQSDKFENQYRIFSDTVDAGRGQPTLGEMISRLADILRLEG
ncbi:MAG: hypothetical protein IJA26_00015 [Clostridia bacterium]|nr:hypothetical protein [Clostridia bacterium]